MTDLMNEELIALKQRADMLGIDYRDNIGIAKLRERVNQAMSSNGSEEEKETSATSIKQETRTQKRNRIRAEQLKLIRCRITNMNPSKRDLHGEIVTFSNKYVGNVRRFIPFGEQTDEGYHVEQCLYNVLKERKFTQIRETRDPRTGEPMIKQRDMSEFALEVLPTLTQKELDDLAKAQMAAGSIDSAAA